jgi:hypothetical protein
MRAAMLSILLEDQECRALLGQKIAIGDYTNMIAVQKQLLQALGLHRVPRDVTPDPLDYASEAAE